MNISNKAFIWVMCTTALGLLLLLPALNYYIDRYSTFRALNGVYDKAYLRKDHKYEYNFNDRFIPISYAIDSGTKYDSFVIGSSKTGYIDTDLLNRLTDGRWFKLYSNGSAVSEHLHTIKTIHQHMPVRNILLGLAPKDFLTKGTKDIEHGDLNTMQYPLTLYEWLVFYKRSLFKLPDRKDISMLFRDEYYLGEVPERWYHREDNYAAWDRDAGRINMIDRFIKNKRRHYVNFDDTGKAMSSLQEIIEYARDNRIHLTIYLHPVHYKQLLSLDSDGFARIKSDLVKLTPYYDFSTINAISAANRHWDDTIHYDPVVSRNMLEVIYRPEANPVDNFGVLVSEKNIDGHIANNRHYLRQAIPRLLLNDTNIRLHDSFLDNNASRAVRLTSGQVTFEQPDSGDGKAVLSFVAQQRPVLFRLSTSPDKLERLSVMKISIDSPSATRFSLLYDDIPSGKSLYSKTLEKGENIFFIPLPGGLNISKTAIRLDQVAGKYTVNSIAISALK